MGANISEPSVTLNIIPASQLAGVAEQKALVVGQMLAAGTATSGALIQDHPNDGTEDALFGQRSHIAGIVREFKLLNKVSQLDILPLDDATGTQGTAVFAITGIATETGSLYFTLGSVETFRVKIDVTSGDAATAVGTAVAAAFTALADAPFTTANVTGTVTATASNDGTLCNAWDIKIEGTVAGIAVALTGWTGGATDPTLTSILDVIANIRYQTILWPSGYDLAVLETELDSRFNVTNDILDGVGIQVKSDTLANLKTYADQNSQSINIVSNKTVSTTLLKGNATSEMPDIICAQVCALRALRLTTNANLTQYLTTVAPSDQFGGIGIASLPYFNTSMPNLPVASAVDFFTKEELDELRDNGLSVIGPNRGYTGTIMGEMVTTYLTDVASNPDDSYKFLNTVDTASVIREFYVTNYKARYAQTRLTDGDLIAGRDMANEGSIIAFTNELYDELAEDALVQSGTVAKKDFNDNLVVDVAVRTGTVTITMAPLLVTQLRVILGTIQINFGS